jgi:hypothetical protein
MKYYSSVPALEVAFYDPEVACSFQYAASCFPNVVADDQSAAAPRRITYFRRRATFLPPLSTSLFLVETAFLDQENVCPHDPPCHNQYPIQHPP